MVSLPRCEYLFMRCIFPALLITLILGGLNAQPFEPPTILNPGGDGDSGNDAWLSHLVDANGTEHVVWASDVDINGSGTDPDLFYTNNDGSGWTSPERVNSYGGSDSGDDERHPILVIGPDGTLHCVWQTNNTYGGAGPDFDIFYSQNTGSGWSSVELVNSHATTDQGSGASSLDDTLPTLVVNADGNSVVAWVSDYPLPTGGSPADIGDDEDILFSIRSGGVWSPAHWVNTTADTDTGDDEGPCAMGAQEDGDVIAVWSTTENLGGMFPIGTDRDLVYSILPPGGVWGVAKGISRLARFDTGEDSWPSIVTFVGEVSEEIHIVWISTENQIEASGPIVGTDSDILYTMIAANQQNALFPPNPTYVVNSTAEFDDAQDINPTLIAEPGHVLHCVWQSTFNLDSATGTDLDLYHSSNATTGGNWSPMELVNSSGLTANDGGVGIDEEPRLAVAPDGLLSIAWQSTDTLSGTVGSDYDVFRTEGPGRGVSRPRLINRGDVDPTMTLDKIDQEIAIAVGPDGTIHAVWSTDGTDGEEPSLGDDYDILYSALTPDGVWSDPEDVNTDARTDSGDDIQPAIAVSVTGEVHVVWSSEEDLVGTGSDRDIFHSVRSGGVWSAPQVVNSSATTDIDGFAPDDQPQIAINASGEIHLVWASEHDVSNIGNPVGNLQHSVFGPSGWSVEDFANGPTAQSSPTDNNTLFRLTLDHQDAPHIVWQSDSDYLGAGTDTDIFHSSWNGNAWTTPDFVNVTAASDSAEDSEPAIAFTSDGNAHVVWMSDLDVEGAGADVDLLIATNTAGEWSSPEVVSQIGVDDNADPQTESTPLVVADAIGRLHITWLSGYDLLGTAGNDLDILYTMVEPEGPFPSDTRVRLANPSGHGDGSSDELDHDLAMGGDGRPKFAWVSGYDQGNVFVGIDDDCFLSSGMEYFTFEDILNHLLGRIILLARRAVLADRNSDGKIDAADLVDWLNSI